MQILQFFKVYNQRNKSFSLLLKKRPLWGDNPAEADAERWMQNRDGQAGRWRNASNDWNIDEYNGRARKGGMTYSSGTVSFNQLLCQHLRQAGQVKHWALWQRRDTLGEFGCEGMGSDMQGNNNSMHCHENCWLPHPKASAVALLRYTISGSGFEIRFFNKQCKANNGTVLEQILEQSLAFWIGLLMFSFNYCVSQINYSKK